MNDLISRNDALNAIAQYCVGCESCNGVRCKGCQIDDAIRVVEDCEAVDAEPVRHARWEHGMQCHFCKQIDTTKPNYCPNCGAKMDGGD